MSCGGGGSGVLCSVLFFFFCFFFFFFFSKLYSRVGLQLFLRTNQYHTRNKITIKQNCARFIQDHCLSQTAKKTQELLQLYPEQISNQVSTYPTRLHHQSP
eukprot:TRINITY_DN10433_c0_g1_i4.p2 TRINITY_DN10433_c0_g1~~TRINITY_DN10433_c0_g1_i4.p2  ORF type:complete len:112 (-),score=4.68 TRINITY_DN10433_c0_g1_i4:202-504(-)